MSLPINASMVTEATEVVRAVTVLVDVLAYAAKNPYFWLFLIVYLAWFFLNKDFSHITKRNERNEHERLSKIKEYIENNPQSRKSHIPVLNDFCDAYYFKLATRIHAESDLREGLINLKKKAGANITWKTMRRALPFIYMENNEAKLRDFNVIDRISKWTNIFISFLFSFIALTIGVFILVSGIKTIANLLLFITLPIIFFIFSLFILSQNFDIDATKKIKNALKKP